MGSVGSVGRWGDGEMETNFSSSSRQLSTVNCQPLTNTHQLTTNNSQLTTIIKLVRFENRHQS
ncbi:MAG: hypothetical protein QNJ51_11020 [Calothrix sp. MO_167.B12]|nr:hypothetical protein [Calothrix sp. MO_167.B12]